MQLTIIGQCECGKPATMQVQKLFSPTERTPLKPICFECFKAECEAEVRKAEQAYREQKRAIRNN